MKMRKIGRSNLIKYYTYLGLYNIMTLFTSGTILQVFLNWKELTSEGISLIVSFGFLAQTFGIGVSTFFADKIKNVAKVVAVFNIPLVLFPILLLYFSAENGLSAENIFSLIIPFYAVFSFCIGVNATLGYKLPYHITDISNYGTISSVSGIISNLLGIGSSFVFVLLTGIFEYQKVIFSGYLIVCVAIVLGVIAIFSVKKYEAGLETVKQNSIAKEIWAVLKTPFMKFLIVPNFLRGIGSGILGMSAVIMIAQLGVSENISSVLSVAMAVSVVIGCIVFGQIYRRVRVIKCILVGGLIGTVFLCLMIANKNPMVFVLMYSLTWLCFTFVDYGIPVYVTQIVGYEHMGTYSAIRMLIHMSGTTVATFISGKMIDNNSFLLLLLGGGCITIAVVSYYVFEKIFGKRNIGA